MRNALDDLTRPAAPLVEAGAPARRSVALRVTPTDARVREVVVSRAGRVVCKTPGGACVEVGLPGHRTYGYLAVAVDEWGRESAAAFISAAVPNTPPALRLVHSRRSFHAVASDADGDRLVYRWRVDGRRWPTGRSTIKPRLDNGRHLVEVTVTDGHGGRTTKRLRLDAS